MPSNPFPREETHKEIFNNPFPHEETHKDTFNIERVTFSPVNSMCK